MTTHADFNPQFPLYTEALSNVPAVSEHQYDEEFWQAVEDGAVKLDDATDDEEEDPHLLEGKAIIRRVRDARGARRYGQPIGSIIRRDKHETVSRPSAAPDLPHLKPSGAPTPEARTTFAGNMTRADADQFKGKYVEVTYRFGKADYGLVVGLGTNYFVIRTEAGDEKNIRYENVNTIDAVDAKDAPAVPKPIKLPKGWSKDDLYMRYRSRTLDGKDFIVWQSSVGSKWTWSRADVTSMSATNDGKNHMGGFDTPEAAMKAATVAMRNHEKTLGKMRDAFVRAPNPGTFLDNWAGIRGHDWGYDGDPEVDWSSDVSRKTLQKMEADELGINMAGVDYVGHDYVENMLATFRAYEQMFPGITYYQRNVAWASRQQMTFDNGRVTAAAYNTVMNPYRSEEFGFTRQSKGEYWSDEGWEEILLAFNTHYFGTDEMDADKLAKYVDRNNATGFSSTRGPVASEYMGWEKWQTEFINTANHEIGHTFARVAFGHLRPQTGNVPMKVMGPNGEYIDNPEYVERRKYSEESGVERRMKFFNGLQGIFQKYDMAFTGQNAEVVITSEDHRLNRDTVVGADTKQIAAVLSSYGATNLHELCAEVWAEYMTDPEPRAFSRDVGDLMWAIMDEYLDNEGAR